MKNPEEVRAQTCGTKSLSRSEALRFIASAKSPSTKIDGSLVNFRRRLSNRHRRPRKILISSGHSKDSSDCKPVYVIRTSWVLSPDRTWPDRWLSKMHERRGLAWYDSKYMESKFLDNALEAPYAAKNPGEVRAQTCGTKSPSRSEALRFIDSAVNSLFCLGHGCTNSRSRFITAELQLQNPRTQEHVFLGSVWRAH